MKKLLLLALVLCISCSKDNIETYETLNEYVDLNSLNSKDHVIACAASKADNSNTVFVFFYPVPGATDFKYFETENTDVEKSDLTLYSEVDLSVEPVFNGYLQRFVRNSEQEVWCTVTYKVAGELRMAQPIRLKHQTYETEWSDEVQIAYSENSKPTFSWQDGLIDDNAIYFQVVTNGQNDLLSGTYTYDKSFTYYDVSNVVLNVTREEPPALVLNDDYGFTMMGVSLDNWVNLVIQKDFQIEQ